MGRLIYSQVPLLLEPRVQKFHLRFHISDFRFQTCDLRSQLNFRFAIACAKKEMKAERWANEKRLTRKGCRHTSRHTSPKDGDARDSRKGTASSSRRLPAFIQRLHAQTGVEFFANRYFDCQKTKRAGFKPPREAARSLQFSRFSLRFGSGSPLPRINA
jgi:hypothetical protein